MGRRRRRRRKYSYTDGATASDTIIAFVIAGLCLSVEAVGFIASVFTKGNVPEIFGTLYLCAIILSVTGMLFGIFGHRAQEGGVSAKRMAIILNLVGFVVPIVTYISGLI
ncbi:MAG: hypothetical protein IKL53_10905 [Lachnospiraceae bacterium]|nr:hypothetical protein [Lachnospiraceae bacterium]